MPRLICRPLYLLILWLNYCQAEAGNLFCYYDTSSYLREGAEKFTLDKLDLALNFCDYLVYGYAAIDASSSELKPLHYELDVTLEHYRNVNALKQQHKQLRVLLSVGGDRDISDSGGAAANKYLQLLEEEQRHDGFVRSALTLLKEYGFDGLDLAWQFPRTSSANKPNVLKRIWSGLTGLLSNANAAAAAQRTDELHKEQFSKLVAKLHAALQREGLLLSYTQLPHVPASRFLAPAVLVQHVDFINIGAFDFQTPLRTPKLADYPAPLQALYERDPTQNVAYHVNYWLNHTGGSVAAAQKLNVGIPAYGRAWIMSKRSGLTGYPPLRHTHGQAPLSSLLRLAQICALLHGNRTLTGAAATLRKVGDPKRAYGFYAYRAADDDDQFGIWIGYEDPIMAAAKAAFARAKGLGGAALFDLTLDDSEGVCYAEKYPILRSIKYELEQQPKFEQKGRKGA